MRVREILQDPDKVLATFDYFNDYKDTRDFLSYPPGEHDELIARLDAGEEAWWEDYRKRMAEYSKEMKND